jgi:hypothetical protein
VYARASAKGKRIQVLSILCFGNKPAVPFVSTVVSVSLMQ